MCIRTTVSTLQINLFQVTNLMHTSVIL